MIESFFVWLLGPELALLLALFAMFLFICAASNAYEICRWLESRNARK